MPTRAEILDTLSKSQEHLFAHIRAQTPEELERICTSSEAPDSMPWRAKDHFAHLALIERAFQRMIRRTIEGKTDPVGFSRTGATNREEVLAWIHQQNQTYTNEHYDDSRERILTDLTTTRQESLALLEQLTDEQLTLTVPGAPWADGTIGGLLITNAHHARQHLSWIEEGLRQQA
jgi:hypothetical protein